MRSCFIAAEVWVKLVTRRCCCSAYSRHILAVVIECENIICRRDFNCAIIFSPNVDSSELFVRHLTVIINIAEQPECPFTPAPAKSRTELMMIAVVIRKPVKLVNIKLIFGRCRFINSRTVKPYDKF